ncbi:MAG: DNA-binding protein [Magnetococcales bacterium]|nr:DNA-binding protein [Magnetococcales bacterium]
MSSTTNEQIITAIEEIVAKGGNPTLAAIRAKVGGSFSSIGPVLTEWKKKNRVVKIVEAPKIPEQILSVLERVTAELWQSASQESDEWSEHIRLAHAEVQQYSDALAAEKKENIEAIEALKREHIATTEALKRELIEFEDKSEREKRKMSAAYDDEKRKITEAHKALEGRLRKKVSVLAKNYAASEKKLKAAEEQIKTMRESLAKAKREIRSRIVKWSGA